MNARESAREMREKDDEIAEAQKRIELAEEEGRPPDFADWILANKIELTPEMIRNHQAGRTMMFESCLSCGIEFGYYTDECPACGESLLAQRMEGC